MKASRSIFRNRSFRLYFGMNLSSRTAGAVATVSVVWFVFAVTHSAIDVAIIGIAASVGTVAMTLPAGVWVDRHDRRGLLLLTNVVRAASLAALVVVTALLGFQLAVLTAFNFIWSAASELYRSADHSVLPELVEASEIADANGVTMAGYNLLGSVSNALGGALIVLVGALVAFSYSAAGYIAAVGFSLLMLHGRKNSAGRRSARRRGEGGMGSEITEGMRWLVSQRGLFGLSLSAVIFNFFLSITFYFLVVYVALAAKGGALLFGTILAAFVIGNAGGSLLVGRTQAIRHTGKTWLLLNGALMGALTILMGAFPLAPVAIAAALAQGLAGGFGGNVWLTSAQNIVPAAMRGRYFAIDGLLSFIGGAPAIAVGGIAVTILGVVSVYEISGIVLLLTALAFTMMKSLWKLDGSVNVNEGMSEV